MKLKKFNLKRDPKNKWSKSTFQTWDSGYEIEITLYKVNWKKNTKLNPNQSNVEEKNWKNNFIKKKEPKKKQITIKKMRIKIDIKEYWQSMAWNPRQREKRERKEEWVVGDATQPLIHHTLP
jgi:hypothetical protein